MTYKLLINGELVDGVNTIDVINPATEEVVAVCPVASEAQLEDAIAGSKRAYRSWRATSLEERRKYVLELADALHEQADSFARLLTQEQGKPIAESSAEIEFIEGFLRHFAVQELPIEVVQDDEAEYIEVHRRPLGVVAGIAPWNFPVLIGVYKLGHAILAGNTFILKPAPSTPLTSLKFGELCQQILPPGVVNVIADDNDLGPLLTQHPDIAKVSFTGSTATGKKVFESAASSIKRLTLELGGNDAAIVLDDVDPKTVAPQIFGSAFMNCGQVCIAVKRLYVHASIYDELCAELAKLAQEAIVGDGLEQGTQIGPLQNAQQFEKVKTFLEDARENGKIIAGGEAQDRKGYFIAPTIVTEMIEGSKLVDEEQFGPILPVMKFDEIDEVLDRANNTTYGLGGSVWSSDPQRAIDLARHVESGTVWVNRHLHFGPHIPFGGAKQSGLGTELGDDGFKEFTQTQVISVAK